jgi:VIT1/CCC1 family predicted Fe2+/Mn2+ transporter
MQIERHKSHHVGWLRAAVLGANDGIVSTASLIVGMAAGKATHANILLAGFAGLAAGALSMAAGEYVSVSSQADTESADLKRERGELETDYLAETQELTEIYVSRGVTPEVAVEVAEQLMAHDAIGTHAREELGITDALSARPIQASLASAAAFTVGAVMPLLAVVLASSRALVPSVVLSSLLFLAILGAVAARTGGAAPVRASVRVCFWGALAMAITAGIGLAFGTVV